MKIKKEINFNKLCYDRSKKMREISFRKFNVGDIVYRKDNRYEGYKKIKYPIFLRSKGIILSCDECKYKYQIYWIEESEYLPAIKYEIINYFYFKLRHYKEE